MRIVTSPALQQASNMDEVMRAFTEWLPAGMTGVLQIEEGRPGQLQFFFDGASATKQLGMYGLQFEAALLLEADRRAELQMVTDAFLKEASYALFERGRALGLDFARAA